MGQKSSKPRRSKSVPTASTAQPDTREIGTTITLAQLIKLEQDALQASKAKAGPEHPETLTNMFALGRAYHGDLKVEKALQIFQELLALREKVLGLEHPETLKTLDAVAEELCNMGKYDQCLKHLIDLRRRCERSVGKQSERSLGIGLDIAGVLKLLGRVQDEGTVLRELESSCLAGLGSEHELTKTVANALRRRIPPDPPDRKEWESLLRLNDIAIPTKIFPNTSLASFPEMIAGKGTVSCSSSLGYEATIAVVLRLRSINSQLGASPPISIPPDNPDPSKVLLVRNASDDHGDNSFQSLISRSIAALPEKFGSEARVAQQAASKHIWFLRSLKSLEELLTSNQHLFWFFQRRKSFMDQDRVQQWAPDCLDRYVLLPVEGGFVNSEDCIFVSHYWKTPEHPDPDGRGLKNLQELLRGGFWAKAQYIWVDWTCLPQGSRTEPEKQYFFRALQTIPRLVRDCSFMAGFEEFRLRVWIIFEVASYILDRVPGVGLPCTDIFKAHLLQMKGNGVRSVLEKYNYRCSSKDDYELVVSWLEILLSLHKTVSSSHTRRQILDAVDKPDVRTCAHKEAGVVIDKERGTLKVGEHTVLFNPFHMEDGAIEISIPGDFDTRLRKAHQRADASLDDVGVSEIAREYDRAGDFKLGEVLHQRAIARNDTLATSHGLTENLEHQELFDKALDLVKRDINRGAYELQQKLVTLPSKQVTLEIYHKWVSQPLEKSIDVQTASEQTKTWKVPERLDIRPGLRRDFLQRLDESIWSSCLGPITAKGIEESCLRMEDNREFLGAQYLHWTLLKRRKESLGPTHPDTRRSVMALARVARKLNQLAEAHRIYNVAMAVCDSSLGPLHPESRAVLAGLAELCLLEKKPGVARSYFRQLLERSLAVSSWNSEETYEAKYLLQALMKPNWELKINQLEESTTVEIVDSSSRPPHWDWPEEDEKSAQEGESGQPRSHYIIDLENAGMFLSRAILAR